ncbi:hypothetical protein Calag_0760 [Caldisphaera lagunensis DSM 15908]|uniref:Uncharacterized protein n=1 Tax=Caldisphaera lagunensis (strain DSM 15908 / JCM 11604 / ANMR 0165 / IC-154) TaxID=1056495 RepID=L0AAQ1_CALLD|nr:hypothetical protein [Caldisphaera lagunensis]AFZ70504.1 hypothetical protein Calag_0760 [Caldisphaera lagunensis DSM 15908]
MKPNYSKIMKIVHEISMIMVYISLIALIIALYIITRGFNLWHAKIMLLIFLPIFITGVSISYSSSSLKPNDNLAPIILFLQISSALLVLVLSIVTIITNKIYFLVISLLYFGIVNLINATRPKGDIRLSVALIGYTGILSAIFLILNNTKNVFEIAIGFIFVYAISLIYSVTIHSFPNTFKDKPNELLVYLLFILQTISTLIYQYYFKISVILFSISIIVFYLSINIFRYKKYSDFALNTTNVYAKAGTLYLLYGQAISALYSIVLLISSILFYFNIITLLDFIHLLIIGFVGIHIFIHAPLMLPVILRWTSARRYSLLPYILIVVAALIWPFDMHVAFLFLVLAIVFLVLIVKPSKEPIPLSLINS